MFLGLITCPIRCRVTVVTANNVSLARHTLESCISDITSWCSSRRLQLNAARQMLEKLTDTDLTLDTGTTVIRPLKSVRDLGVHLDSELTMKTHISKVVSCCYHQLRRIRQVRRLVSAGYVLPRTRTRFGERGFSYCGPAAWNTLPSDLHHITDTSTFRKRLKSVLFDRAYH